MGHLEAKASLEEKDCLSINGCLRDVSEMGLSRSVLSLYDLKS